MLEGVAPEERYLEMDRPQVRVRVLEVGAGEPVLFVHGGGSGAQWTPLLARIRGRRLLAVDRPGCGLTSSFDNRDVDLRAHAVDLLAGVLDGLGIAAVDIVASSMGATWSVWLALDRPERVRSLALLGCPANVEDSGAPLPFRLLGVPVLNRVMYAMEPVSDAHGRKTFRRMGHDPAGVPVAAAILQGRTEALPTYRTHWLSLMENVFPGARWGSQLASGALHSGGGRASASPHTSSVGPRMVGSRSRACARAGAVAINRNPGDGSRP